MTIGVCLIYGLMYKAKPRIERSLCCTCIHILYMYFTKGSIDGEFFFGGGGKLQYKVHACHARHDRSSDICIVSM